MTALLVAHVAISLVAIAGRSRRGRRLAARAALLIFQSFLKVPALRALAPTQSEPPFAAAQGVHFLAFVVVTVLAVRRARATGAAAFARAA